MWQAYVYPTHFPLTVLMGREPVVGKLRHSRKEARLEARRLAQDVVRRYDPDYGPIRPQWGMDHLPRVHEMAVIDGYTEPTATYGVRWQPDPDQE